MFDKTSRFFLSEDESRRDFFFSLHPTWWSRFYEYPWAASFSQKSDIALDAASGICHPFKFFLAENSRETHAVDSDPRILSEAAIRQEVAAVFGESGLERLKSEHFKNVNYRRANLENLPYPDQKFDKIYCISVLEHLNDWFNKYPFFNRYRHFLKRIIPHGLEASLAEFKRVLKDDGLIILTFDYPTINLEYLRSLLAELGLHFADTVDFDLPENRLISPDNRLSCFRAVLTKKYDTQL